MSKMTALIVFVNQARQEVSMSALSTDYFVKPIRSYITSCIKNNCLLPYDLNHIKRKNWQSRVCTLNNTTNYTMSTSHLCITRYVLKPIERRHFYCFQIQNSCTLYNPAEAYRVRTNKICLNHTIFLFTTYCCIFNPIWQTHSHHFHTITNSQIELVIDDKETFEKTLSTSKSTSDLFNTTKKVSLSQVYLVCNLKNGLIKLKQNLIVGLDGEAKIEIAKVRFSKLSKNLISQDYSPKFIKKVQNSKTGFLNTVSIIDELVQLVLRDLLEPIVKPFLSGLTVGSKFKKNHSDALYFIKSKWQILPTWIVNINLNKQYKNTNYQVLHSQLKKFCEQPVIELIKKFINAGHINLHNLNSQETYFYTNESVPLRLTLSYLLNNVYLNELDQYVMNFVLPKYNRSGRRQNDLKLNSRIILDTGEWGVLQTHPELRIIIKKITYKHSVLTNILYKGPDNLDLKRLYYVRYLNNFVLGFFGPKFEIIKIAKTLKGYLELRLHLKYNTKKFILKFTNQKFNYLETIIQWLPYSRAKTNYNNKLLPKTRALEYNNIHIRLPIRDLLKYFIKQNFLIRDYNKKWLVKSKARTDLSLLKINNITIYYNKIIQNIVSYYVHINKKSDLRLLILLLRRSYVLTIAYKLKLKTTPKVFFIYGRNLYVIKKPEHNILKLI
nr:hypothetical protein [Porphyridium purpureum]UBY46129.1 hypothetical protein [Porphyridium purpureum]